MLGLDNMIREMIREQFGLDPEELKRQLEISVGQAKATIDAIVNNQRFIAHQNKRIISLLEKLVGEEAVAQLDEPEKKQLEHVN